MPPRPQRRSPGRPPVLRPLAPKSKKVYERQLERVLGPDFLVRIANGTDELILDEAVVAAMPENVLKLLAAAISRYCADSDVDPVPLLLQLPKPQYRLKKAAVRYLTEAELESYVLAVRTLPPRIKQEAVAGRQALALLPLAAGLRAEEVLALTRDSVLRAEKTGILLVQRKGGELQELEHQGAKRLFADLLTAKASSGMFRINERKKPVWNWHFAGQILSPGKYLTQYHIFHALVRDYGAKAGIAYMHPHSLRHAFATRFIRDGGSLAALQVYLNHKDIRTTMRYVHMSTADAQPWLRKF